MFLWWWIEYRKWRRPETDVPEDKEKLLQSIEEQSILMDELVFLFATSVIQNVPQMKAEYLSIYSVHLHHRYTAQAGEKTKQVWYLYYIQWLILFAVQKSFYSSFDTLIWLLFSVSVRIIWYQRNKNRRYDSTSKGLVIKICPIPKWWNSGICIFWW